MKQKLIETRLFEFKVVERKKENLREGVLLKMRGLGQRADERNANERIYSGTLWDRIFLDEKFQNRIATREMLGEADHPEDGKTSIPRVSHLVTQVEREGTEIYVEIEILDTPAGRIVEKLVNAGVKIGISSRGTGSVIERNGESYVNEDDFELETWDLVTNPSTRGAYPSRVESTEHAERNNKIVLQTAAQLCESETDRKSLRTVKGIVADLQTKLFAEEKRDLLRHINENLKQPRKESAMNRKGVKRPVRTPIGQTVELAEALADKKAAEKIRESAQRVRSLRKQNAQLTETNRRMKARLEQLSRRRKRVREQDEEDYGIEAEVVDEPTELEVDGIVTIIPNPTPGEENEEMPERRRISKKRYLERRRRAMLREKGKACAAKDRKKKRPTKPAMNNERRRLVAAKRVIEKQHRELQVAKRIIEYMAHNTVSKKQYEKARTAVKKLMAEHGQSEWKHYVNEQLSGLTEMDRKRILKAVGQPKTLNEAKQRLASVLDVAKNRKTGARRKVSERHPLPGGKVKQLTERRRQVEAPQQSGATKSLMESVLGGVEKKF